MKAENFWMSWLKVTTILIVLAGIGLIVIGITDVFNFLDYKINNIFFAGQVPDESISRLQGWLMGVAGSIMAGWGSAMFYLITIPLQKGELWAWRCIFYPVMLWFVLDSFVSTWFGAMFNVTINVILFLQLMAPLLFLRNSFRPKLIATA